jgi:hypothetical protein
LRPIARTHDEADGLLIEFHQFRHLKIDGNRPRIVRPVVGAFGVQRLLSFLARSAPESWAAAVPVMADKDTATAISLQCGFIFSPPRVRGLFVLIGLLFACQRLLTIANDAGAS